MVIADCPRCGGEGMVTTGPDRFGNWESHDCVLCDGDGLVEEHDGLQDFYEAALPKDAPGAWIRAALERRGGSYA